MNEPIHFRTVVKLSVLSVFLFLALIYVSFQGRHLIIGPQIILSEVPAKVQNQKQIFLTGKTYNISRLWLNDRTIYTDTDGNFNEPLILENGYTVATLRAVDRYGRETTVAEGFVYQPVSFVR